MGQFVHDGILYEELPNGKARVIGAAGAPQSSGGGQVFSLPKDPAKAALDNANIGETKARTDKLRTEIENANAPKLPEGWRWVGGKVGGQAERVPGLPPEQGKNTISADVRAKAIAQWNAARTLDRTINELQHLYEVGPGSTKGIKGLSDYFGTQKNDNFDTAADAARGIVKNALGLTGGELNTPGEAVINLGPYIPHARQYDSTIEQSFERLKALRDNARNQAIQTLGGVPDANGNVTPVQEDKKAVLPGAPELGLATGGQKFTPDEPASRLATELVRNGMSDEQVNAALQAGGFAPLQPNSIKSVRTYLQQNPGFKGAVPGVGRFESTNWLNQAASSPEGTFLGNMGVSGLAGLPVALAGQQGKQAFDLANAENPKASLLGSAVGGTAATIGAGKLLAPFKLASVAPRTAALLGDTLYGATYGGATADEGNRTVGALAGAAGGTIGNFIGQGGARLAGKAARGVVNPAVDYLRARGIPLTGGQIAGGFTKRLEDTLAGYGFAGAPLRNRLTEGVEALNKVGYNIAGDPIQANVDDIGRAGLDTLNAAKGAAYDTSLGNMNLVTDAPYAAARAQADAAGAVLPDVLRPTYDATTRKVDSFIQPGGVIPGRNAQAIKQTLRTEMRANKGTPGGQFLNDALGEADGAFMDMAARQAPEATALYRQADLVHGRSKVLERAVNAASGKPGDPGVWTGAQLASALKGPNVTQDARAALGPLAENSIRVLPSQVPDSGTAGRLALGALAAGSPLAGVGYVTGGRDGAETGGALGLGTVLSLAALNTKAGRTMAEKLLLDRPDIMRRFGTGLIGRSGLFGGAGLGVGSNIAGLLAN